MLGPLEDALRHADELPPVRREEVEVAHRNALRLLRLVNALLDFSRVEAGRLQARFERTDLPGLTRDLASNFRSACERAGLALGINCEPLSQPVYVDRDMWEKIVLNLISNAFKFTLSGSIEVRLRDNNGARAELTVSDTGVGIPAAELPRVFERFHRVEGQRGRTHEGSGIGLALVRELVKLHGGEVRVDSEVDRGTTVTVSVPYGEARQAIDQNGTARGMSTATRASAFVEEALRWLPNACGSASAKILREPESLPLATATQAGPRPRMLAGDDNADMRDYVRRLLASRYAVETAVHGVEALEAARRHRPDLVLADVMMPVLDGFGLLQEIRRDRGLSRVPVILLSARAGEEAKVVGLDAGADDYLIKPFSARELLARVNANIAMARLHREYAEEVEAHKARLQTVLETVPAAVWFTFDADASHATGNRYAAELLRIPETANASLSAPQDEKPQHFRVFKNGIEVVPAMLPLQRAARGETV
ncbi:MAG: ATP-binding protein [Methylocella sp.]